jgi:torulene dioxygenase
MAMPNSLIGEIPHRYIYTIVDRGLSAFFDGISRADTLTQTAIFWDNPRGYTTGEAIFLTDPNGSAEDDGVLLSVVLDGFKGTSYFLCLDARDLKELGRVDCKCVVGLGFHGAHVKAGGMASDAKP